MGRGGTGRDGSGQDGTGRGGKERDGTRRTGGGARGAAAGAAGRGGRAQHPGELRAHRACPAPPARIKARRGAERRQPCYLHSRQREVPDPAAAPAARPPLVSVWGKSFRGRVSHPSMGWASPASAVPARQPLA